MTISLELVVLLLVALNIVVLVQNVMIVMSSARSSTQLEKLHEDHEQQNRMLEFLGRQQ